MSEKSSIEIGISFLKEDGYGETAANMEKELSALLAENVQLRADLDEAILIIHDMITPLALVEDYNRGGHEINDRASAFLSRMAHKE
jgi:hypothetical protein